MTPPEPVPAGAPPGVGGATGRKWPADACPRWCTQRHPDRLTTDSHHSTPSIVPVNGTMHRATSSLLPSTLSLEAIDLSIRLGRHPGELVDWLIISATGTASQLALTAESAWSLSEHLRDQLTRQVR